MKFKPRYDLTPVAGRLLYVARDYAINFMPTSSEEVRRRRGEFGEFTLGVDTLQLVAGLETRQLISAWGVFPRPGWRPAHLELPSARGGAITVELPWEPETADYAIPGTGEWKRFFDQSTGWVMAGDSSDRPADYVEFVQGAALAIRDEQAVGIWLHPEFVETLPPG
jgi:hypothetical protein